MLKRKTAAKYAEINPRVSSSPLNVDELSPSSDDDSIQQDDEENHSLYSEHSETTPTTPLHERVEITSKISMANTGAALLRLFEEVPNLTLTESSLILERAKRILGRSPKRRDAKQNKEYSSIAEQVKRRKNTLCAINFRKKAKVTLINDKSSLAKLTADFESLQQEHARLSQILANNSQQSIIEVEAKNQTLYEENIFVKEQLATSEQTLTQLMQSTNALTANYFLLLSENASLQETLLTTEQMVEQLLGINATLLTKVTLLHSQALMEQPMHCASTNSATDLPPQIYQEYITEEPSSSEEQTSSFSEKSFVAQPLVYSYMRKETNPVAPENSEISSDFELEPLFNDPDLQFNAEDLRLKKTRL